MAWYIYLSPRPVISSRYTGICLFLCEYFCRKISLVSSVCLINFKKLINIQIDTALAKCFTINYNISAALVIIDFLSFNENCFA